jgi:hypothetical protein
MKRPIIEWDDEPGVLRADQSPPTRKRRKNSQRYLSAHTDGPVIFPRQSWIDSETATVDLTVNECNFHLEFHDLFRAAVPGLRIWIVNPDGSLRVPRAWWRYRSLELMRLWVRSGPLDQSEPDAAFRSLPQKGLLGLLDVVSAADRSKERRSALESKKPSPTTMEPRLRRALLAARPKKPPG